MALLYAGARGRTLISARVHDMLLHPGYKGGRAQCYIFTFQNHQRGLTHLSVRKKKKGWGGGGGGGGGEVGGWGGEQHNCKIQ